MRSIDEILDEFKDINYAYNDSSKFDTLKRMLTDALESTERLLDQNTERCEGLRKQLRDAHENYEKHLTELQAKLDEAENSIKNYKDLYLSRKREELLLAQQIPKEGRWEIDEYGIYHCPICHAINNTVYKMFCPNCGTRLKGEGE